METISNKTEILFLYDIENANPNGDPLNENRPRFDADTSTAVVSDVRLKRTIRDYWYEYKGYNGAGGNDIFVREMTYNDAKSPDKEFIQDGKRRAANFGSDKNKILNSCIDVRVFGGVIPLKEDSITFTGPVQFQMGRSLNKVEIITEQGTGAFAAADGKKQSTFRTEYKLPYALIGFNGVVNDVAAKYTGMTKDDLGLLLEGIWEGTKNLISRSKFGQKPVFLLTVTFRDSYYLGGLRQRCRIVSDKNEETLRNLTDYSIDVTDLADALKTVSGNITELTVKCDPQLSLVYKDKKTAVKSGTYGSLSDLFPEA